VKVAEEYALAHTGDRLYVTDLCKVAAVSERTLEYGIQGRSRPDADELPARLRLHRSGRPLLAAAPESTTVSDRGAQLGFWHFGESRAPTRSASANCPSDTLRPKS